MVRSMRSRGALSAAMAALLLLPACTRADDGDRAVLTAEALADQSGPRAWAAAPAAGDQDREEPLPIRTGWGPTADEIERARALVADLSLKQRAGQVIVARYRGTTAPTRLVNGLHLGGVVVFSDNISSNDQIRDVNRALQRSAKSAGRRFPVTISVDQEGGLVERVTGGTRFPAFMTAGAAADPGLTRAAAAASGAELAGLGFTIDFAPDADVTVGASDAAIGSRSASSRPQVVAEHVVASARGYGSRGVVPVLKHFPGHGGLTTDSHLALPVQRRTAAELERTDYVPFRAGIEAGLPAVMVGHVDVRSVDPGMPSSLSAKVITGQLRDRLGFEGLVVTDALDMNAVADRFGSARAAGRALAAGADVLLMPPSPREARDGIVQAVRSGRLSSERLVQAATRQVALLLHQKARGTKPKPPGSGRAVSTRWSAAAVTSVAGPCSGRLVGRKVRLKGDPTDVARLRPYLTGAGVTITTAKPKKKQKRPAPVVRLLGYGDPAGPGDVVVALDRPYVLGASRARVKLATYGTTPGALSALTGVLLGEQPAPGHLPVPVGGVGRTGC
jgi:beta-N-acetylhexosaminidase